MLLKERLKEHCLFCLWCQQSATEGGAALPVGVLISWLGGNMSGHVIIKAKDAYSHKRGREAMMHSGGSGAQPTERKNEAWLDIWSLIHYM